MANRAKRVFLWVLKNSLNRVTIRAANAGRGPFSLIRHTGRNSGKAYETPVILARLGNDFIAELTYGPKVQWYRNIVADNGCVVVFKGAEYVVDGIEDCDVKVALKAFGRPESWVLRLLRRRDFRLLHTRETNFLS